MTILFLLLLSLAGAVMGGPGLGRWETLQRNIGITAMHMQLLHNDRVVVFDRTDFGLSNISLPAGRCRRDPDEVAVKIDCSAHSVEYSVATNRVRPLTVLTDVWCSSGGAAPDGRLVQTGGFNDGDRRVRVFNPCDDSACDWEELHAPADSLSARRWYATNQALPDGTQIIIGGRKQFNYEFYPKGKGEFGEIHDLKFLSETNDVGSENNLYPFVHLVPSGELFVFANNRAVLFDYKKGVVVRAYPEIPGGDPRNYPSTGSSVLLPIRGSGGGDVVAEVLVCGGAPRGAYLRAGGGKFDPALKSCGRIRVNDPQPEWVVENMPVGRVMGDMVLLPNGEVLIVNGAGAGTAGWEYGRDPVLTPVLYRPGGKVGSRFDLLAPTKTPRMYHSTAVLVKDGRVLVGGSNPHMGYKFGAGVLFPTELSLEAYSPPYLDGTATARPAIVGPLGKFTYAQKVSVGFTLGGNVDVAALEVTMVAPSFTTHSFSMNQRLLVLDVNKAVNVGKLTYRVEVTSPGTANLAPPGYYLLFVVYKGIPSEGIWVHLQ